MNVLPIRPIAPAHAVTPQPAKASPWAEPFTREEKAATHALFLAVKTMNDASSRHAVTHEAKAAYDRALASLEGMVRECKKVRKS